MLNLSEETQSMVKRISEADTDTFSELIRISRLDPASDFTHANLQNVDFRGSDLSKFNFKFADLRGATWDSETSFEPAQYMYALRGRQRDPVSTTDRVEIIECALNARTWGVRFFAFALAVDNFGEVDLTLELLAKIVREDGGKYMKFSSYLYFLASYLNNGEALEYCRTMASASNSYNNMFRFKKLKRLMNELGRYAESTNRTKRYPGEVPVEDILNQAEFLSD